MCLGPHLPVDDNAKSFRISLDPSYGARVQAEHNQHLMVQTGDNAAARGGLTDQRHARFEHATTDLDPPLAMLDTAAFESNAADLVSRAAGKPIRVASKT